MPRVGARRNVLLDKKGIRQIREKMVEKMGEKTREKMERKGTKMRGGGHLEYAAGR
jgi:hypothetical protein